MRSVARKGSFHAVEHESKYLDPAEAAKLAAESALPSLAKTSATQAQQHALVEAMRLILINDVEKARTTLSGGGFSSSAVEQIFPLLLGGLKEEA
jgi:hypothetical protein